MTSSRDDNTESGRSTDDYADVGPLFEEVAALPVDDPRRQQILDDLVVRCLPLAEHIARRFYGRGEAQDDLVQVARLGLVNAVNRFDVTRGADFVSYAVPTIMGEVRRHFRDTGWAVRVPRRMQELHMSLSRTIGDLSQQLGRSPTIKELSETLDVEPDDVAQGIMAGNAYHTVSVDATGSAGSNEPPLAETLGDYDAALENVENHEALRPLLAALPERERKVVLYRFFGNMTQTQIADQLGISQMHVSRLLGRTLAQLREKLE